MEISRGSRDGGIDRALAKPSQIRNHDAMKLLLPALALALPVLAEPTVVSVFPDRPRQEFQGMGCGAIFYEAHITSLGGSGRPACQAAARLPAPVQGCAGGGPAQGPQAGA